MAPRFTVVVLLTEPDVTVIVAEDSFSRVSRSVAWPSWLVRKMDDSEARLPALVLKTRGTSDKALLSLSKTVAVIREVKSGGPTVAGFAVTRILMPVALPMSTGVASVAVIPAPDRASTAASPARPLPQRKPRATPFCISTRCSMMPTFVVKKICVPSGSVPPPSSALLKPVTVIVETPLTAGMAVGLAEIESSEPIVAVSGTLSQRISETNATISVMSEPDKSVRRLFFIGPRYAPTRSSPG